MQEESKCYSNMKTLEFIRDVLQIKLTRDQELLIEMYEECRGKKVNYIPSLPNNSNYFPIGDNGWRDTGLFRPITTYDDSTGKKPNGYEITMNGKI